MEPGEPVGAGLTAGQHELRITAKDHFGQPIYWTVHFTSDHIPAGAGVGKEQGDGAVSLSAAAVASQGRDVTTEFWVATATVPEGGVQGVVTELPETLEFAYTEEAAIEEVVTPDGDVVRTAVTGDRPFQRFDVEAAGWVEGQLLQWQGQIDPQRVVALHVWDATAQSWTELASARGDAEGETVLQAAVPQGAVVDGIVHAMVIGEDPFADDLAPRDERAKLDKDALEDPADYDFSFVHLTDTQFISEAATGTMYSYDGVATPLTELDTDTWRAIWRDNVEWIVAQQEARKIAYVAHSGDVTENYWADPAAVGEDGEPLYPGMEEQIDAEFALASEMLQVLEDGNVVHQIVAGNHDNGASLDTSADSRLNTTFRPERYRKAAESWRADASYHAHGDGEDADGNPVLGERNEENYVLFSAGGLDFVAVGTSYGVTPEEAQWASDVFARYPDRNGILVTHSYLVTTQHADGRDASHTSDDGRLQFEQVVAQNPNVFLVLAGHMHGVGTNLRRDVGGVPGHNVVKLLADYQDYRFTAGEVWPDKVAEDGTMDLDGDGVVDRRANDSLQMGSAFLRMLQFDVERGEVSIDTYSPHFDSFDATRHDNRNVYNGAEDNMVLPVDLSSRTTSFATDGLTLITPTEERIGEDTTRSGWPATVTWTGLEAGKAYAWVALSRPAGTEAAGLLQQVGNVFVATDAGTDSEAPVLTVPGTIHLAEGASFDPMAGVSAEDAVDGDVTDRIAVQGTVDTSTPGTYVLTYLVTDANGNQAIATRVVMVVAEEDAPEQPVDLTVATAGTKIARTSTNLWGTARHGAGQPVVAELLTGDQWVEIGSAVVGADERYIIPLGGEASSVGTHVLRARVGDALSEEVELHRVAPSTSRLAAVTVVDRDANAWGTTQPGAAVTSQVLLPERGWTTSQRAVADAEGRYVLPLTFGRGMVGTLQWRVVVEHDFGQREVLDPMAQRRVARPWVSVSPMAPVGADASIWGVALDAKGSVIRSEVHVEGKGWLRSQTGTVGPDGRFVLPLTYGSQRPGVLQWRVVVEHPEVGGLASEAVTQTRHR